jgi:hypothetical protein
VKGFMFTISQWLLQPLDRLNFDGWRLGIWGCVCVVENMSAFRVNSSDFLTRGTSRGNSFHLLFCLCLSFRLVVDIALDLICLVGVVFLYFRCSVWVLCSATCSVSAYVSVMSAVQIPVKSCL